MKYNEQMDVCEHLKNANEDIEPRTPEGCEECLKTGDHWTHLRLCLTCGHVGCCDTSTNKHATKHFETTKHPVMKTLEEGKSWKWCFIDEEQLV